jgi:hypothetical protein
MPDLQNITLLLLGFIIGLQLYSYAKTKSKIKVLGNIFPSGELFYIQKLNTTGINQNLYNGQANESPADIPENKYGENNQSPIDDFSTEKTLYFTECNDDSFLQNAITTDKLAAIYILRPLKNENRAIFEVLNNEVLLSLILSNITKYLLPACEILDDSPLTKTNNSSGSIDTKEFGLARFENGNWLIEKKAVISITPKSDSEINIIVCRNGQG